MAQFPNVEEGTWTDMGMRKGTDLLGRVLQIKALTKIPLLETIVPFIHSKTRTPHTGGGRCGLPVLVIESTGSDKEGNRNWAERKIKSNEGLGGEKKGCDNLREKESEDLELR